MDIFHLYFWVGVLLLNGITLSGANDSDILRSLCDLYRRIHGENFINQIGAESRWSNRPNYPNSQYYCSRKSFSVDGIRNDDIRPTCLQYRLDSIFYDFKRQGRLADSVNSKIKKYLLYMGLQMTGDYTTLHGECGITQSALDLNNPELYDEIAIMLGLVAEHEQYNSPTNQQCTSFLTNTDFGKIAVRTNSDIWNTMFSACQRGAGSNSHFCRYFALDKFSKIVGESIGSFRATATPCQVLQFAFVHSSFFFIYGIYTGTIVLEDTKIKEVLRSTLSTLASNVKTRGCQSEELRNYNDALLVYDPKEWYENKKDLSSNPVSTAGAFQMYCDVVDAIVLVSEYLETLASKKRIVDAKLDYRIYLQTQEITGTIDEKFNKLGDYFVSIQNFNREKSQQDLIFVDGRLKTFDEKLTTVSGKVGAGIGLVLDTALEGAIGNLVSKAAKLALAYAEACNPFKTLFGGTTLTDIAAATSEFAEANAKLKESRQLMAALETLKRTLQGIQDGFEQNKGVLDKAYKIVTQKISLEGQDFEKIKVDFIKEYGDYNPAVDKNQIALVGSQYETVVNEACDLISDTHDVHDLVLTTGIGVLVEWFTTVPPNPCLSTKWEIAQMTALLEEIFDFQNELMETCASHLRARIAEEKALMITSSGQDTEVSSEFTREDRIDMGTIYHHIDHCTLIQEFCAILEYRDGGRRPSECNSNIPNIPRLLGSRARPKVEEYQLVNIPDVTEELPKEESIDIDRLMSGQKVSFQIPNFDWLQEHGDVHASEREHDIFVKNVVVFAPFLTDGVTSPIISKAEAVGDFQLQAGIPTYVFGEPFSSTFKYSEGTGFLNCGLYNLEPNPYTICEENPLDKLCPKMRFNNPECNDEDVRVLFPSIYTKWNFQLLGYEDTLAVQKLPVAKTKRSVKIAFIVCKFQSSKRKGKKGKKGDKKKKKLGERKEKQSITKRGVSGNKCCQSSEYYDEDETECRQCPGGSYQMLNGYYCGEDHPAQQRVRKRKKYSGARNATYYRRGN